MVATDPERLQALAQELAPDLEAWVRASVPAIEREIFEQLAPVPPETGVIAIAFRPQVDVAALLEPASAPVVLLENPAHLGNIGAVVRVAAAAGAAGVLTTGTRDPWQPAALRGSAGLHYTLPVARIDALAPAARPIVALHPDGEPLSADAIPPGAILAFGTERGGLSPALRRRAQVQLAIPMRAGVSSLNLATAVAVVLYARRPGDGA